VALEEYPLGVTEGDDIADKPEAPADADAAQSGAGSEPIVLPPDAVTADRVLRPSSLAETLQAAISAPRGLQQIAEFAMGWARQMELRVRQLDNRVDELERQRDQLLELNATLRAENSALEARADEIGRHKPLIATSQVLAPILVGIGLDAMKSEHKGPAYTLIACAVGLIVISLVVMFWPKKKR
jgi:hypothetical protein